MDGVLDWDGRDIKIVLQQPIKCTNISGIVHLL